MHRANPLVGSKIMLFNKKLKQIKIIGFIMSIRLVKFANRWLNLILALKSIYPVVWKIC